MYIAEILPIQRKIANYLTLFMGTEVIDGFDRGQWWMSAS